MDGEGSVPHAGLIDFALDIASSVIFSFVLKMNARIDVSVMHTFIIRGHAVVQISAGKNQPEIS